MTGEGQLTRQDIARVRNDLGAFAELIGRPLQPWQLDALRLETRHTALLAPRQTGKSYSLAVLVSWWLFRKPNQEVLVLSAREDTAKKLLRVVRQVAALPLLRNSIVEDLKTKLELSNGSVVEAVPSSDAAVRGRSIDLLVIDEAAFVDDDLIQSAALPTTVARPDARVVLASTPWGRGGTFFDWFEDGSDGSDPDTKAFRWTLSQAPWIVPKVIEAIRRRMPPLKFAAEFDGQWVGSGDAYFNADDIRAAVAGYPAARDGGGAEAVMGVDWGRMADAHGVVVGGLLDDYGVNGWPVIAVAWAETSRRRYEDQVAEIEAIAGTWKLKVMSETVGVGAAPTEQLASRLTSSRVVPVKTSQQLKEYAYGKAAVMFAEGRLVIPAECTQLISQLETVTAAPTPGGGLRIGTPSERVHDDLADAFVFMLLGLPEADQFATVPVRPVPDGITWAESPGGLRVPVPFTLARPDMSWGDMYGGSWTCGSCHAPQPAYKADCQTVGCAGRNPEPVTAPAVLTGSAPSGSMGDAGSVPESNMWNPNMRRCLNDVRHSFDGAVHDQCPHCRGPHGRPGPFGGSGLPLAHQRALTLGMRR